MQLLREVVPRDLLEQLKHLNTKTQEVALRVVIFEKKKNISDKSSRYTKASGGFSNTVVPDIDYFTDGPVVQYDVKNIFRDYYT